MKRASRDTRTELERIDDEILELVCKQVGERDYRVFEELHVRIMDLQKKRRELWQNSAEHTMS